MSFRKKIVYLHSLWKKQAANEIGVKTSIRFYKDHEVRENDCPDRSADSEKIIDEKSKQIAYTLIESHLDSTKIRTLLKQALTNRIDDREIFMKGIDYSYYYEQAE